MKQLWPVSGNFPTQQQNKSQPCSTAWANCNSAPATLMEPDKPSVRCAQDVQDAAAQAEAISTPIVPPWRRRSGTDALACNLSNAASLDSQRFAPFPMQRYQPKRFSGQADSARRSSVHDRNFDEEVVVKTLHEPTMERSMSEVFRRHRLLRKLNHPAIIGVHECEYADPVNMLVPTSSWTTSRAAVWKMFIEQRGTCQPEDHALLPAKSLKGCRLPISKTSCTEI